MKEKEKCGDEDIEDGRGTGRRGIEAASRKPSWPGHQETGGRIKLYWFSYFFAFVLLCTTFYRSQTISMPQKYAGSHDT